MKFLFDLLPVILFFVMFKWGSWHPEAAQALANQHMAGFVSGGVVAADLAPILLATAVSIAVTIAQIVYLLARRQKVGVMLWVSLGIISALGGATIYFNSDTFIKWKPTVLYWSIAGALLLSQTLFKKNLIRAAMEKQLALPENLWSRLNLAYVIFFGALGFLNIYVAFNFSTATWVDFKVFGGMGLMFAFMIAQTLFLAKYVKDPE